MKFRFRFLSLTLLLVLGLSLSAQEDSSEKKEEKKELKPWQFKALFLENYEKYIKGEDEEEKSKVDTEAKIKAVFMYNFTKYMEWPNEQDLDSFSIGVYGNPTLYNEFLNMTKIKKAKGKPFAVHYLEDPQELDQHQMVFFGNEKKYPLELLYSIVRDKPTLIVTAMYSSREIMCNFIRVGNRMKFEMNEAEINRQGIKVATTLRQLSVPISSEKNILRNQEDQLSMDKLEESAKESASKMEELSNEEYDKMVAQLQLELEEEIQKGKSKDAEIENLKSEIDALEVTIQQKAEKLRYVQEQISRQSAELLDLSESVDLKEEEYYLKIQQVSKSKMELAEAKKTLDQAKSTLANTKEELKKTSVLLSNQKLITYATLGVLLIIAILGFVAFRNYRKQVAQAKIIQKQKQEAEEQRDEIHHQHVQLEEKNREITDSINYAKRIQEAILPPMKLVKSKLENSFVFYKPKDIVAGDFYWMDAQKDRVIFAAADCTGHGVPGAMVSVVCSNALNRSVREFKLIEPAKILDKTLEIVIERFEKSEEEVKDGMDIALCAYEPKTKNLHYAGAHNPLYIIKKNAEEVTEIKGNKQPIGKYAEHVPFMNHNIQLEEGDAVYLFSDGYIDQFGGEKGKKFKSVNFKKLLLQIQKEDIQTQYQLIKENFETWMGDNEQLDDVCVIGFQA